MVCRYLKEIVALANQRSDGRILEHDLLRFYSTKQMARDILQGLVGSGLFRAGMSAFYLNREVAKERGLL